MVGAIFFFFSYPRFNFDVDKWYVFLINIETVFYSLTLVFMGSAQVPFHTVIPYGERGTEVLTSVGKDTQIKFHMSYKAL